MRTRHDGRLAAEQRRPAALGSHREPRRRPARGLPSGARQGAREAARPGAGHPGDRCGCAAGYADIAGSSSADGSATAADDASGDSVERRIDCNDSICRWRSADDDRDDNNVSGNTGVRCAGRSAAAEHQNLVGRAGRSVMHITDCARPRVRFVAYQSVLIGFG